MMDDGGTVRYVSYLILMSYEAYQTVKQTCEMTNNAKTIHCPRVKVTMCGRKNKRPFDGARIDRRNAQCSRRRRGSFARMPGK